MGGAGAPPKQRPAPRNSQLVPRYETGGFFVGNTHHTAIGRSPVAALTGESRTAGSRAASRVTNWADAEYGMKGEGSTDERIRRKDQGGSGSDPEGGAGLEGDPSHRSPCLGSQKIRLPEDRPGMQFWCGRRGARGYAAKGRSGGGCVLPGHGSSFSGDVRDPGPVGPAVRKAVYSGFAGMDP